MKSGLNQIKALGIVLFLCCVTGSMLFGQVVPQVNARFTNPQFDSESRKYFLDVELSTNNTPEHLFGMDLRFFYDASLLEFQNLDQLHQGYGIIGEAPKAFLGNETSGAQLFSFTRAASYVHGAIQVVNEQSALEIFPTKWVKAFRLCFKVPSDILNEDHFCPSVIFDKEKPEIEKGFLPGSAGLLITVMERHRDTREESIHAIAFGYPINWQYDNEEGLPHGNPASSDCISISGLVFTEEHETINSNGYALFQNLPNPFDQRTTIDFILPYAQEATLTFYDNKGTKMEEIKGDYVAGRNQVVIKQKQWMVQSNVIYYRLHTEKYTSKSKKMALVRA